MIIPSWYEYDIGSSSEMMEMFNNRKKFDKRWPETARQLDKKDSADFR
jgi:hypothetical protein